MVRTSVSYGMVWSGMVWYGMVWVPLKAPDGGTCKNGSKLCRKKHKHHSSAFFGGAWQKVRGFRAHIPYLGHSSIWYVGTILVKVMRPAERPTVMQEKP